MKKSWKLFGTALIALSAACLVSCASAKAATEEASLETGSGTDYSGTYTASMMLGGQEVRGETVVLNSDGTWSFSMTAPSPDGSGSAPVMEVNGTSWVAGDDDVIAATAGEGDAARTMQMKLFSSEQTFTKDVTAAGNVAPLTVTYTFEMQGPGQSWSEMIDQMYPAKGAAE